MRLKQKGSVEWVALKDVLKEPGAYADIEIGFEHHGPGQVKMWSMALQAMRTKELNRLIAMRKGNSQADAPELFDKDEDGNATFATAEGAQEAHEVANAILGDCLAGVRGVDGYEHETDRARLIDLIKYLGLSEFLIAPAMNAQALKSEQIFTKDPSSVESSRSPESKN